jgi:hypothetical protein
MFFLLPLFACQSDPLPRLPPGSVRIAFSARGEGEIEPCG